MRVQVNDAALPAQLSDCCSTAATAGPCPHYHTHLGELRGSWNKHLHAGKSGGPEKDWPRLAALVEVQLDPA